MPAAFNPDVQEIDQTMGAHRAHTSKGSRFGPEDVRGPVVLGANVQEAITEYRRGNFTDEDLKQLAFAMGYQVIGGKDTAALAGQVTELKSELANAQHRADMAEAAFKGKPEAISAKFDEMETRATTAETALATANTELAAMTTRATTAEAALVVANTQK